MSLATIRTRALYYLSDPDARFWTAAKMLVLINEKQRQIATELKCLETYATASSVADTQFYDVPTNFYLPRGLEYRTGTSEPYKPLKFIDTEELKMISGENYGTTGVPEYWFLEYPGLNKIGLYPIPASAVTAGIKVWMWKLPTDFSADGDTGSLTTFLQDMLVYGVVADAWLMRENGSMSSIFEAKYEKGTSRYLQRLQKKTGQVKNEDHYWWK